MIHPEVINVVALRCIVVMVRVTRLYIVIAKSIGVGQIEVAWGLYLFTAAVLTSLIISLIDKRKS